MKYHLKTNLLEKTLKTGKKKILSVLVTIISILVLVTIFAISTIAGGTSYYVTTSGSNTNSGTNTGSAWKTISYAVSKAKAGDTIYVKAGNYGNEKISFGTNGTSSNPITLEGYKNKPGDNPDLDFNLGDKLSTTVMPMLNGGNRSSNTAINLGSRSNIIIKNFQITNYQYGVNAGKCNNVLLENIIGMTFGDTSKNYSGYGMRIGSGSAPCSNTKIKNCIILNSAAEGIIIRGSGNTIEGSKVLCNDSSSGYSPTDYYLGVVTSNDSTSDKNIIKDCYVERVGNLTHGGHGVVIKGGKYNKVINCTAKNFAGQGYDLWHTDVQYNELDGCKVIGGEGVVLRGGANNNIIRNCLFKDAKSMVKFCGETYGSYAANDNVFYNCIAENVETVIDFDPHRSTAPDKQAAKNMFVNCTIAGADRLFTCDRPSSDNKMINSIVTGVKNWKSGSKSLKFNFEHTLFHNNGFSTPSGTGNKTGNPLFENSNDYHLKSGSPCIDIGIKTNAPDKDFDGNNRPIGSAIDLGAFEHGGKLVSNTPSSEIPVTTSPLPQQDNSFQQDAGADGIVSIEIENYNETIGQEEHKWNFVKSPIDYSGTGAMQSIPNTGAHIMSEEISKSPRMDYKINFLKKGTHYIWMKGAGSSTADNSYHIGLNGKLITTADNCEVSENLVWAWSNITRDDAVATIDISKPGEYNLNIWMREDGTLLDKMVLTTNKSYVPTGKGPTESKPIVSIPSEYKGDKVNTTIDIPTDGVITINPGDPVPTTKGAKIVFNPGVYNGYKIVPKDGQKFYAKKGVELVGSKKDGPDESYTEYAFWGDADDVYIGGFVIRDYNTNYQHGAIHSAIGDPNGDQLKIGQRWIVENVEVKNCVAGINIGSNSVVRNSWIHHNDVIGVKASYAINTLYDNVRVNNNGGDNPWGWGHEGGGSKFAMSRNLVVRNSYFHDNIGPGLWTDIDNYGTLYENNLIKNNTARGIFHEISYDAIIRNNIIEGNHWKDSDGWSWARAGIYISASQGYNGEKIEIYGNTLKNNVNGITLAPDGRRTISDVNVYNNTLIDTGYSGVDNGGSPSKNHGKLSTLNWNKNIYHGKCKWAWTTDKTWKQWLIIPNDEDGSFTP